MLIFLRNGIEEWHQDSLAFSINMIEELRRFSFEIEKNGMIYSIILDVHDVCKKRLLGQ